MAYNASMIDFAQNLAMANRIVIQQTPADVALM